MFDLGQKFEFTKLLVLLIDSFMIEITLFRFESSLEV